ncbi:unnamed protein product [Coregonus sp. 'balchen']|nr:unnamed protein product [Coregonus sp. 'balchen']
MPRLDRGLYSKESLITDIQTKGSVQPACLPFFVLDDRGEMGFKIIDDLTHLVDKTDDRIRNETRRVKLVETKSASCGMLVVIVLLLIAIVVVAVWPT